MVNRFFKWSHVWAIVVKEFVQMRRDRLTFAMLIGIPIIQLILFGYAINANPRHLPAALVTAQQGIFERSLVQDLKNTDYFDFKYQPNSLLEADQLMQQGKVLFTLYIPPNFDRELIRGQKPELLLTADASNPLSTGSAVSAVSGLLPTLFDRDLQGSLRYLIPQPGPVNFIVHNRYNPEAITAYNIVPGLIGVVLTLTLIMITALAITREYERGTIEALLSTPIQPFEVMIGTIIPYVFMAYIQICIVVLVSKLLFGIPIVGSFWLLLLASLPFIAASLAVGLTFSAVARTQLQAVQLTIFFFLPSILLSGFMFPFEGMPMWAKVIGYCLPMTYYLDIVRSIMLKGAGFGIIWHFIWPMLIFILVVMVVGVLRFRRTLD